MNLCLLFDRDGAIRALNEKWLINGPDGRLLFFGQLVVTDEMVRRAAVDNKGSIRGVHDLRAIGVLA